jgi:ACS family tartrate transporter-like MFS transporter
MTISGSGHPVMSSTSMNVGSSALNKVRNRLVPFLALLYFAAFIDRVNVGFAAAQMNRDLGFSSYVYGLGAGIFFLGYCLFEVPSNLILYKLGARRWISRIMITWAVVAGAMTLIQGPTSFYVLRFLLGVAEAGFFPGLVYYLTHWIPASRRAGFMAAFMTAIPISTAVGAGLSSAILRLDGALTLSGWQWLFMIETIPSLILGVATFFYLPDEPATASWLTAEERAWLGQALQADQLRRPTRPRATPLQALANPQILALSLGYFGVEIGLYGIILWIPQIFAHQGFDSDNVGIAVAIPYAIAAIGMVWWCRRSDRHQERVWHIGAASLVGCLGLAASAWPATSPLLSVLAISVGATGTLAILPIFWTLPAAMVEGAAAAVAIAMINALGNLGGFAGPYLIGWVKQATGNFTWGLIAVALCVLSTGIISAVIGRNSAAQIG